MDHVRPRRTHASRVEVALEVPDSWIVSVVSQQFDFTDTAHPPGDDTVKGEKIHGKTNRGTFGDPACQPRSRLTGKGSSASQTRGIIIFYFGQGRDMSGCRNKQ